MLHSLLIVVGVGVLQRFDPTLFASLTKDFLQNFRYLEWVVGVVKNRVARIPSRSRNDPCELLVEDRGDLVGSNVKHDVGEVQSTMCQNDLRIIELHFSDSLCVIREHVYKRLKPRDQVTYPSQ